MDPAAYVRRTLETANRRVQTMEIKRIGLDLAKYIFEAHAVDYDEQVCSVSTVSWSHAISIAFGARSAKL